MPVRMVALRKHYVSEARKEYNAGETYVVHDKRAAEKLERRMKAKPQPETAADRRFPPAAAPQKVRGRALTAETETPAPTLAPGPAPATLVELPAPDLGAPALTTAAVPDAGETVESKARYARRDCGPRKPNCASWA
jgi:hypothetical protein